MKLSDKSIQRRKKEKTILLTVRVTPEISRALKEKNLSPTRIFYKALEELGIK